LRVSIIESPRRAMVVSWPLPPMEVGAWVGVGVVTLGVVEGEGVGEVMVFEVLKPRTDPGDWL